MIVFDLKCGHNHVFEAWFGSSAAFEEQRARGLVICPMCSDTQVEKALMAPNLGTRSNSKAAPTPASKQSDKSVLTPEVMKATLHALAEAQRKALKESQWVGRAFADRARAMHAGEEATAPIHGQSTRAEAAALLDEGVAIAPLLLPVLPPETLN